MKEIKKTIKIGVINLSVTETLQNKIPKRLKFLIEGPCPVSRGDNNNIAIKIFFSLTNGSIPTNEGTKHPCVRLKFVQMKCNAISPKGDYNEITISWQV